MRYLKKIINRLRFAKIIFKLPSKKKLIIFDKESFEDLKYITDEYDYFLLETRFDNVSKIYLNPVLFYKTLFNYKGNLWTSYLISLIEIVSPKVILTFSDNSIKFFDVAKKMSKKNIIFYAIQNGARYDLNRYLHKYKKGQLKEDMTKKFFIPNFFCFGEYEVDDYKSKGIKVENFFPTGSLRLANYIYEKKINLKDMKSKIYDILLVSDAITEDVDKNFGTKGEAKRMAEFIKYIIKYALTNKKKIIFSLKRLNSSKKNLDYELNFYKNNLEKDEFNFFLNNSTINFKKYKYLTYDLMLKSNLTISAFSTLLRENLSIGRKAISINFMENEIFDFPLNGICKIKRCSYKELENNLNRISKMNDEEFVSNIGHKNYLMNYDFNISAINKIKNEIGKFLK